MKIIILSIVFVIGLVSGMFLVPALLNNEIPFSVAVWWNSDAPGDWIDENQVKVYSDKIVIDIDGASLSKYADSGSMKPVLDRQSNGIRIVPKTENDIKVGDIVSYKNGNELIVHRVVEKSVDEEGVYFILKGDNNNYSDGKVRFKDIKYVTIGVLW